MDEDVGHVRPYAEHGRAFCEYVRNSSSFPREKSRNQQQIADVGGGKLLIARKSLANSKSGLGQPNGGSNPSLSARLRRVTPDEYRRQCHPRISREHFVTIRTVLIVAGGVVVFGFIGVLLGLRCR